MIFRFDSFQHFLQMDGHGAYVWSAYLIAILVMVWLVVSPLFRQSGVRQAVARELRRETARQGSSGQTDKE
ncbi:heme exporter protein CcmD [Porticoccus hydrocarbonoclasticus]|uniref:heme exporter protein CcmD n=1 Tax=Porticoccus hydrocarbonoclasticus TaxID=1073414 RepID=UPI00055A6C64|nr:heme exporter protein CcmD [Porticoccus hydrocarbonoclasticus]